MAPQDAAAKRERIQREPVAPQRRFGLGAACDVVEDVIVEPVPGALDELMQTGKIRIDRVGAAEQ